MENPFNIVEILQNDDVDLAIKYIEHIKNIERPHKFSNNKDPVTVAYMAAYLGARKVLFYLIKSGANIDVSINGIGIRQISLTNIQILLCLIETGTKPNLMEIVKLFDSEFTNDIPRDGSLKMLDNIIRECPDLSNDHEDGSGFKLILNSPSFKNEYHDIFKLISSPKTSFNEYIYAESENAIYSIAKSMHFSIIRAKMILVGYYPTFDDSIVKRFRGYKKHKSWLTNAASQARQDVCVVLAPAFDLYEDDEDLALWIDLAILRYPIRAYPLKPDTP